MEKKTRQRVIIINNQKKISLRSLLQIINPFMWLSPRLVARSHAKFFNAVFEAANGAPLAAPSSTQQQQLTQEQRARLDAAVAAATAEAQAKAAAEAEAARRRRQFLRGQGGSSSSFSLLSSPKEVLSLLRAIVTEPESHLPWWLRALARWVKRAVAVPLALAFPLAAKLLLSSSSSSPSRLLLRDTRGVAVDAMRPWLKSKGLRLCRSYGSGAAPAVAAGPVADDACVFERRLAWECRAFGAVAVALGLLPLLSWLLNFLTTAGAALWAADLERVEGGGGGGGVRVLVPPPAVPAPAAKEGAEEGKASSPTPTPMTTAAAAAKQEL